MAGEAKTVRGRLRQIERWLRSNFTPALPVTVRVGRVEHNWLGTFQRAGDEFHIRINRKLLDNWDAAVETLLHEWAHAMAWSPVFEANELAHEHPDEWGLWMARIYRRFVDEGGMQDADEFSARPWK